MKRQKSPSATRGRVILPQSKPWVGPQVSPVNPQMSPVKAPISQVSPVLVTPAAAQLEHSIDENIPEGIESFFSRKLSRALKTWPPGNIEKNWESKRPVWIRGIKTEGNSTYVGTETQMLIQANLRRVSSLIEDFESYPTFFHNIKAVRITAREGNKITTFWERYAPIFFLPNIKYEQVYIIDNKKTDNNEKDNNEKDNNEKRVTIRYQLKSADSIKFADGLLVLEAEGETTRLTAFDFFSAKWGILGGIAPSKIWRESVENGFKDDIALKTHSEHPDWNRDQIFKECDRIFDLFPVDPIQYVDPPSWATY